MSKITSYTLLSLFSFILAFVNWLFLETISINYALRNTVLRNTAIEHGVSLNTSQSIEIGLFDYLERAHPTYLSFESGPLHH